MRIHPNRALLRSEQKRTDFAGQGTFPGEFVLVGDSTTRREQKSPEGLRRTSGAGSHLADAIDVLPKTAKKTEICMTRSRYRDIAALITVRCDQLGDVQVLAHMTGERLDVGLAAEWDEMARLLARHHEELRDGLEHLGFRASVQVERGAEGVREGFRDAIRAMGELEDHRAPPSRTTSAFDRDIIRFA